MGVLGKLFVATKRIQQYIKFIRFEIIYIFRYLTFLYFKYILIYLDVSYFLNANRYARFRRIQLTAQILLAPCRRAVLSGWVAMHVFNISHIVWP